jgi:hypothetical protein
MTRGLAALGSAVFFLIAPTTVAGVVPWWISRWRLQAPFFDLQLIRWFGVVLILLGIPVLVETFTRFALQGGGTPAPVAPTFKPAPDRFRKMFNEADRVTPWPRFLLGLAIGIPFYADGYLRRLIEFFVLNGCVLNELPGHLEGPDGAHPVRYLCGPLVRAY